MKVLFIGDIFSKVGRQMTEKYLKDIQIKHHIDFTIANGENVAHGKGINSSTYEKLVSFGIDAITLGNHFAAKTETNSFYLKAVKMIRPINIHPSASGVGTRVFDVNGIKIRVTNILGRAFITELNPSNPFDAMDELLKTCDEKIHIVDFHAEATAEKLAFAWNFDGKVTAVIGTHTHVQTADNRILPQGTGYISDVGMTGPYNGIIGGRRDSMIYRSRTGLPVKFDVEASLEGVLCGVVLDIDEENAKTRSVERIYISPDRVEGI